MFYGFVIVSSYTTSLPSPIKSLWRARQGPETKRSGLDTQPLFGEPRWGREIMSLLKDVKG